MFQHLTGTWRLSNVALTSIQRHDVTSTLIRLCDMDTSPLCDYTAERNDRLTCHLQDKALSIRHTCKRFYCSNSHVHLYLYKPASQYFCRPFQRIFYLLRSTLLFYFSTARTRWTIFYHLVIVGFGICVCIRAPRQFHHVLLNSYTWLIHRLVPVSVKKCLPLTTLGPWGQGHTFTALF